MRNYLTIGAVRLRVSRRHLAPWGYARLAIGGLEFFSRMNTGDLIIASYHPSSSHTWLWSVSVARRRPGHDGWVRRATIRRGQWHDYYRLPFGWEVIVAQQGRMPKRRS